MNIELMKRWVAALRSGEYPQTRGCVRDKVGYCCLGVLCDIGIPGRWEDFGQVFNYIPASIEDRFTVSIYSWIRENLDLGGITLGDLISLNDTKKLTFNQIADFIESITERSEVS